MFGVVNCGCKNFLVQLIVQKELLKVVAQYVTGRLLDIGCGTKPYRDLIKPYVREHVGVDHEGCFHCMDRVDLVGTAYAIPVENASFDSVICTAVLEHLEEPEKALLECFRVLKPGGVAVYSVPFIWHLHEEPRDYYRFSCYGLRYIFEKCGFEVISIKALSGFWVTFGQLLVYNLYRANRGPLRWFRIVDMFGLLIQAIAFFLDRLDKTEQWTWMNMIVVRKPEFKRDL